MLPRATVDTEDPGVSVEKAQEPGSGRTAGRRRTRCGNANQPWPPGQAQDPREPPARSAEWLGHGSRPRPVGKTDRRQQERGEQRRSGPGSRDEARSRSCRRRRTEHAATDAHTREKASSTHTAARGTGCSSPGRRTRVRTGHTDEGQRPQGCREGGQGQDHDRGLRRPGFRFVIEGHTG